MDDAPVALLTGTSTGIGRASALRLARDGYDVIATMRSLDSADALMAEAEGASLEVRALDVTSDESAASCVESVLADRGRIDLLVNNAGAGRIGSIEQLTMEEIDATMATNFGGVARMIKLVLPSMRQAGHGRILAVSSVGGVFGQPFNDAYCAAKFAVEGLLEALAPVAAGLGIHVSIIEPGPVATSFVDNVTQQLSPAVMEVLGDAEHPYNAMLQGYLGRSSGVFAGAQSPEEVAAVVVEVASAIEPALRYQTSPAATTFVSPKLADLDGAAVLGITGGWIGLSS